MKIPATTSQTVGPFFSIGCDRLLCSELAPDAERGERVTIRGRVLDADGNGVPDALLELWQANAEGRYARLEDTAETRQPRFTGFGRVSTGKRGEFRFTTVKPGRVPGPDGTLQAPHIAVSVFCRGLLRRLVTRIYFPGTSENDRDFALNLVPASRRDTLIAVRSDEPHELEWNVVLQGPRETVFFDV